MKKSTKLISNLIAIVLILNTLTGCGADDTMSQNSNGASGDIELLEPVGSFLNYEAAAIRDINKISVYQGIVSPKSVEYSYESDLSFGGYYALPGDEISKGDTIVGSDYENVNEEIEAIEDKNAEITENYADYLADYVYNYQDAKKAYEDAANAYQERFTYEPDESMVDAHFMWEKAGMGVERAYKSAELNLKRLEEEYLERQQLFELEIKYNEKRIALLNSDKSEGNIIASGDGTVVATYPSLPGDYVATGTHMVAVGDLESKNIVCDFVSNSVITSSVEYYALIDGKRYEVAYETMTTDEYNKLKNLNGEVYSTFKIADDSTDVELGSYAVIVVIEKQNKGVLTIPKGAVMHDEMGYYVYINNDGNSVYTPVATGESDGAYTEIISGLSEGDKVIYDNPYALSANARTETIKAGSVETNVSATGYLYYPSASWIKNPAKSGTCYLKELCVSRYEQVTEGQVIAKVEVVTDSIEIDRINKKIQRQQERLVDLLNKKEKTYSESEIRSIDKAISERTRSIDKLNRDLEKLTEYAGIIELKASANGIVTDIASLDEGELLNYRQNLIQLAFDDSGYIIVEDKGNQFSYGNEATVVYRDGDGKNIEAHGMVATLNGSALNADLKSGYALIRLSTEDIALIAEGGSSSSNGYWNRNRYSVNITIRSMHNVLLVPKGAVKTIGSDNYVYTYDENNTPVLTYFMPGGADTSNYWVVYGLEEGTKLCLG